MQIVNVAVMAHPEIQVAEIVMKLVLTVTACHMV
jgi:hypothetical protein